MRTILLAALAATLSAPAAAQTKLDFILNWVPGGDHAPYYYAKAQGWYAKEGIDLNIEPGNATFDAMVAGIDRGVQMETNCSWSIDDSRNKFQFGCERGRLIENGKLGAVVKNPNYRGISATFWRSLAQVGNADTLQVLGSPHCGKGEPSQVIRVGHASPACVFRDVAVFGGEE